MSRSGTICCCTGAAPESRPLANRFLRSIEDLKNAGLAQLVQLGQTLSSWAVEIATMWRFTRNNGITEGFHTKQDGSPPGDKPTAFAISTLPNTRSDYVFVRSGRR